MKTESASQIVRQCLCEQIPGFSLRDYFAAKSMQAWICDYATTYPKDVAKWAYEQADAMLKEREK
jgi:hypothetical protein